MQDSPYAGATVLNPTESSGIVDSDTLFTNLYPQLMQPLSGQRHLFGLPPRSPAPKSKVICLAIGDPHFKTDNAVQTELLVQKSLALIEELNPTFVVVLGDVLHQFERIHVAPLTRAVKWLREISQLCALYVLIGNHDRRNNSIFLSDEHPFNSLKDWDNAVIVDTPVLEHIKGHKFLFCPYVQPGRLAEALGMVGDYSSVTALFAHQEFFGAKNGVVISSEGDQWPLDAPLAISGHIHDYDLLQPNLVYTGTPLSLGISDTVRKTVSLFTFTEDSKWSEERIDLGIPRTLRIDIDVNWGREKILAALPTGTEDIVYLVVSGSAAELRKILGPAKLKELMQHMKISYRAVPLSREVVLTDKRKFLDVFQEIVKEEEDLVPLYNEIFSRHKVSEQETAKAVKAVKAVKGQKYTIKTLGQKYVTAAKVPEHRVKVPESKVVKVPEHKAEQKYVKDSKIPVYKVLPLAKSKPKISIKPPSKVSRVTGEKTVD